MEQCLIDIRIEKIMTELAVTKWLVKSVRGKGKFRNMMVTLRDKNYPSIPII